MPMKMRLQILLARSLQFAFALLIAANTYAQARSVDLSGLWEMDLKQSSLTAAEQKSYASYTMTIKQTASTIEIAHSVTLLPGSKKTVFPSQFEVTLQPGGGVETNPYYVTTNRQTSGNMILFESLTTKSKWKDGKLVREGDIRYDYDIGKQVHIKETYALEKNGDMLILKGGLIQRKELSSLSGSTAGFATDFSEWKMVFKRRL